MTYFIGNDHLADIQSSGPIQLAGLWNLAVMRCERGQSTIVGYVQC